MIKSIGASLLAAAALFLGGTGSNVYAGVTVRGFSPCGQWVGRTNASQMERFGMEMWLLGYLSGLARATEKNFIKGTDNSSIELWMDNYCRTTPLSNTADGAEILSSELMKMKGGKLQ